MAEERIRWEKPRKYPDKDLYIRVFYYRSQDRSKMVAFEAVVTDDEGNVLYKHREECQNFNDCAATPGPGYPKGLYYEKDASRRARDKALQFCYDHTYETKT